MLKAKSFLSILFVTVFMALFAAGCSETGSGSTDLGGAYTITALTPTMALIQMVAQIQTVINRG